MEHKINVQKLNKVYSNRGAALISIIIVMTVVSTLGFLGLAVSYSNFRMKNVDRKATENFYGAEKVLEEICTALQAKVSEIYGDAYTAVMTNYDTYDSAMELQEAYENYFYTELKTLLYGSSGSSRLYDLDVIRGWLSAGNSYTESQLETMVRSQKNYLDDGVGGIYIRNLCITFEEDGYEDRITTDIKISVPEIELDKISTVSSELTEYAVIAEGGVAVLENSENNAITGKVFAGLMDAEDNILLGELEEKISIHVPDGAKLTINNTEDKDVIVEGDILVDGNSIFTVDANTSLWATSLTTSGEGAEISLLGKSYIKDDLTLNGEGSTLKLAGEYYGYSGSTRNAGESSAIIVNGKNTTLDMSGIEQLVVSGTSFVATQGVHAENESNELIDVMMGDSVAVKSNQLIYMVPTECEGIACNPMTYDQFDKMAAENVNWEEAALNTYINGLGRSIASYGNVTITPVYTYKDGGAVYLYLEFASTEAASAYFLDCFENVPTKRAQKAVEYFKNYVSAFTINAQSDAATQIRTAGNYLTVSNKGITYQGAKGSLKDMNLGEAFAKMCEKNYFDNMIDSYEFDSLMSEYGTEVREEINEAEKLVYRMISKKLNDTSDVQVVIIDIVEENYTYVIDSNNPILQDGKFEGVIIVNGDVQIDADIKGTVICKGKLSSKNDGMSLTSDSDIAYRALNIELVEESGMVASDIFVGNRGVSMNNTSKDDVNTSFRDCITFENWEAE